MVCNILRCNSTWAQRARKCQIDSWQQVRPASPSPTLIIAMHWQNYSLNIKHQKMSYLSYISAQEIGATVCLTELFLRYLLTLANIYSFIHILYSFRYDSSAFCDISNYLCVFKNVKLHNPKSHLHFWDGVKYVFLFRFCP